MLFQLVKNTISLVTFGIVDKLSMVLFLAILARKLDRAELGIYSLVLTLIVLGSIFVTFGVENVVVREIAKDKGQAKGIFASGTVIALASSLITWPLVVTLAVLFRYSSEVIFLLSFGGAVLIFMGVGQIASAVLKAYEKMEVFALIGACHSIISIGISILVLFMDGGLTGLVIVLLATEGAKAAVLLIVVHRRFVPLNLVFDATIIRKILRMAIPFAALTGYGVILHRADILFMGWLRPLEEVAIYSVSAKFTDSLSLISASMVTALYPALSVKAGTSQDELQPLYHNSIRAFGILGFGTCTFIVVLARPIILFLFGANYLSGVTALQWLGWAFLFSVISGPVGTLLLATGQQMYQLLLVGLVVLAVNILLNLWLIPLYSYNGAAVSVLVCAVLGFLGRLILSKAYFRRFPPLLTIVWRALLASVLTGFLLMALNKLDIIISVLVGGLLYLAILAALGEFRQPQYAQMRLTISKRMRALRF
jgi:O-antigen/teichoic acid export membrane protein